MLLILVFLISFNSSFADNFTTKLKPRKGEEILCGYAYNGAYTSDFITIKGVVPTQLNGCPTSISISNVIKDSTGKVKNVKFPVTDENIAQLTFASTLSDHEGKCLYKVGSVELTCDKGSF